MFLLESRLAAAGSVEAPIGSFFGGQRPAARMGIDAQDGGEAFVSAEDGGLLSQRARSLSSKTPLVMVTLSTLESCHDGG